MINTTPRRLKGTSGSTAAVECLFDPRSVAVVGASADMRKWGGMAAEQALRDAGPEAGNRKVYLVNARGGEIMGRASFASYGLLPEAPELAVVTVPQPHFETAIDAILEKGTRSIIAITAGFAEEGAEGQAVQDRVAAKVRAAGAAMIGPNCMGIFDGHAPFRCMPWAELKAGNVALVSQSGGYIMDIAGQLEQAGKGLSRVASVGNEADVAIADIVDNLASHGPTRLVMIYCEDFSAPERLFTSIAGLVASHRNVVLMTPQDGEAARRAALLHTGSSMMSVADISRQAAAVGAHHALSPRQGVDMTRALLSQPSVAGRRVAILSDTGGPAVLCAGLCEAAGLVVPAFSEKLKAQLAASLSPRATCENPVDLVDNLDVDAVAIALRLLLQSDEIDAVLMNVHAFVHDSAVQECATADTIWEATQTSGKPVVLITRAMNAPGVLHLMALGCPVYRHAESAVCGMAALCGSER